jgi:inactivated superfamily I helicase
MDVTTRDYDTGPGNRNTIYKLRLRYDLADAAADDPTIAASYSTGPEGAAFTALSTSAPENDGTDPYTWRFVKRTRRARFRFLSSGPSANLKLRVVEVLVRPSSRS